MSMCCPPRIPAQAEGQADCSCRAECRAEGCVRGHVYGGDSHEHAAEVEDWPDRPHGHAEAVGASHGLVVLVRELTEFACEWYESADDDMFFGNCATAYGTLVDGVRVVKMAG